MPNRVVRKLLLLGDGFPRASSSSSSSSSLTSEYSASSSSSSTTDERMTPSKERYGPALMSERLSEVESIITRWDAEGEDEGLGSLFGGSRVDARRFFNAVSDLGHFMKYLKTANVDGNFLPSPTAQDELLRTRRLMDVAMKLLLKEFFRILSVSRDRFGTDDSSRSTSTAFVSDSDNDESSHKISSEDDDFSAAGDVERLPPAAMADLRSIANCMISAGYAKECVKIYLSIRKSIVDERLYCLGFHRLTQSQIDKLDEASVENWIKNWLAAARIVINTLFAGERRLCDFIFGSSENIKESCFAAITGNAPVHFLEFPALVAASFTSKKAKKKSKSHSPSPVWIYYLLDLHNCIADLWPEIEKVFSYITTSAVQSQAISSLQILGASVRHLLADFEYEIQKNTVKEPTIPGGGLHPLTRCVMDVLVVLSEYCLALDDIYFDQPLPSIDVPCSSLPPSVSARFAWLVTVLLAKLGAKADLYKDSSLSYLFLANNLRYIVDKVVANKNLWELLGDVWVEEHEETVESFVRSYDRMDLTNRVAADHTDDI